MQRNEPVKIIPPLRTKITLIVFGLSLSLLLLEIGLRLGGFFLLSLQEHRNMRSIKQEGAYRLLCLGESTTQGQYPQFLEEALNQRDIGVRFSVIDKGKGGTNTPTILNQVESYLGEYRPNMVVTMMGINDSGNHVPFEAAASSQGALLIKSFRTYKLIRLLWLHILTKAKEIGLYNPHKDNCFPGNLARIRLGEGYDESIATENAFKKALELNPQNDQIRVGLGWFYRDHSKFSQAEDEFKKALEFNPKNDKAYFGLGALYRDHSKFSQAEDAFRKALELNPQNDQVYAGLGWFYRDQGKFSQAEDAFKKALELNPKNVLTYSGLEWLYRDQGRILQVEDSLKKALELNPRNDFAYIRLGVFYLERGEFSRAEDALKKAIELNPQNDKAYRAISVLYGERGNSKLEKEYTEKADRLKVEYYNPVTVNNYRTLKEILDKKKIRLVCVQYPMRNVESLKKIFKKEEGIIFVDNESVFKEALKKANYKEYFRDMFGGYFGHCTEKGNRLLAENIATTILKEVFKK